MTIRNNGAKGEYPRTAQNKARFESHGFPVKEGQITLTGLDENECQSRLDAPEYAADIDQYVLSMKSGAILPLPVVTSDGVVVTGKTTVAALRKLGYTTISVLVLIDVDWATANQAKRDHLIYLDVQSNREHGTTASPASVEIAIRTAMLDGVTQKKIAGDLFLSVREVGKIIARIKATDRLMRLEFSVQEFSTVMVRALGKASDNLGDETFKALSQLVLDARVNAHELGKIMSDIKASDEASVVVVRNWRALWADRINAPSARPDRPRFFGTLRMGLGQLNSLSGNESNVFRDVSLTPDERASLRSQIAATREMLAMIENTL